MLKDLGNKSYFRITIHELENLGQSAFVRLTLPEGKLTIPVGVLLDRFATSRSWLASGVHSSSTFPQWLAPYRQGSAENQLDSHPDATNDTTQMQNKRTLPHKSGATDSQRQAIRQALFSIAEKLSTDLQVTPEAVVLEMRYFHQSATNPYRTKASEPDKNRSLKHHNSICQALGCNATLALDSAVFHHLRRGLSGQHEPENLLPHCETCHDKEHKVSMGKSLSKGSRS